MTELHSITTEAAKELPVKELFGQLDSRAKGLTSTEARERLDRFGPNEIVEKKVSALRKFLGYFWGPIPGMIEAAAILSAAVRHWQDFSLISALLLLNAGVGFWQEHKLSLIHI